MQDVFLALCENFSTVCSFSLLLLDFTCCMGARLHHVLRSVCNGKVQKHMMKSRKLSAFNIFAQKYRISTGVSHDS